MKFLEWLAEQSDRDDIVGEVSRQCFSRKRIVDALNDECGVDEISRLIPKTVRKLVILGLKEAKKEWNAAGSGDFERLVSTVDVLDRKVESTVFRLTKRFKAEGVWGPPIVDEEIIPIKGFVSETAKVGSSVGLTLNLGNMDFLRVDSWGEAPCYPEEMKDMATFVERFCSNRLDAAVEDVVGIKAAAGSPKSDDDEFSGQYDDKKRFDTKEEAVEEDGDVEESSDDIEDVVYEPPEGTGEVLF